MLRYWLMLLLLVQSFCLQAETLTINEKSFKCLSQMTPNYR